MKVKKKISLYQGGCVAFLLVVVVLGLFSLIGCDNGNGGSSSSGENPSVDNGGSGGAGAGGGASGSETNNFVGTWKTSDGKTLVFTPGGGMGDGTVTGTLVSAEGDCFYMVTSSTVAVIKKSTGSQGTVATVTYNPNTGKLSYSKTGSNPVTLTKQQ